MLEINYVKFKSFYQLFSFLFKEINIAQVLVKEGYAIQSSFATGAVHSFHFFLSPYQSVCFIFVLPCEIVTLPTKAGCLPLCSASTNCSGGCPFSNMVSGVLGPGFP